MKPPEGALSPSEVDLARGCLRKWAASGRYLNVDAAEWPREQIVGGKVGTELHMHMENYGKHGRMPARMDPVAALFVDALPHLPKPEHYWLIEDTVEFTAGGLPFLFKPDWYGPGEWLPGAVPGYPALLDFKTSVDPKRYGVHTEADKLDDVQTLTNSYALMPQGGTFNHLYLRKTGQILAGEALEITDPIKRERKERQAAKQPATPRTIPTPIALRGADIVEQFHRVVMPVAQQVFAIRRKANGRRINPLDLPPTPGHCDEYGGCPHKSRCNLTPEQILRAACADLTEGTHMSDPGFNLFASLPPINGPAVQAAPVAAPAAAPQFNFTPPAPPAPQANFNFSTPVPVAAPVQVQTPAPTAPQMAPAAAPGTSYVQNDRGNYVPVPPNVTVQAAVANVQQAHPGVTPEELQSALGTLYRALAQALSK